MRLHLATLALILLAPAATAGPIEDAPPALLHETARAAAAATAPAHAAYATGLATADDANQTLRPHTSATSRALADVLEPIRDDVCAADRYFSCDVATETTEILTRLPANAAWIAHGSARTPLILAGQLTTTADLIVIEVTEETACAWPEILAGDTDALLARAPEITWGPPGCATQPS